MEFRVPTNSRLHARVAQLVNQAIFDHPVVVTSKGAGETVKFRVLTSFTDKTGGGGILATSKSPKSREKFLLAQNLCNWVATHDGTRLLTVSSGSEVFKKPTYVNIQWDQEFEIEYQHLAAWSTTNGQPITFDQASTEAILNCWSY